MSRQVRMVPAGWEHPKDGRGRYKPLLKGPFSRLLSDWDEAAAKWDAGLQQDHSDYPEKTWKPKGDNALKYATYAEWSGKRPAQSDYMPEWAEGEANMLVMYEDTSEGTPISPAFATPEELARWLADNDASAFAGDTATYEQWLSMITSGRSPPSAVVIGDVWQSGVAYMAEQKEPSA